MSTGDGVSHSLGTMRGRDYPTLRQFTVFLENRVGQLRDVVRRIEISGNRILAFSISDSAECAFVRFLFAYPERGRETLERADLAFIESDCIGVELPQSGEPIEQVCLALLQSELNIVQAYPLLARGIDGPAIAIMVDNTEVALETLSRKGFRLLHEGDLRESDPLA
jgi:hypothetical protein